MTLMNDRPKTSAVAAKTVLLLFSLSVVGIFLMNAPLTSSIARVQGERVFENIIPKDVPIKVRIKKEKENSFKDLKNEKWVREFELEVTNSGDKPIYFLFLDLITDVKVGRSPLMFTLTYGRKELGRIATKSMADDVPIKPGETFVFQIHPGQVPAWQQSVRDGNHAEATRIQLKIEILSFGDGTGYFGNHPYPRAPRQQSGLDRRERQPNKRGPSILERSCDRRGLQLRTSSIADMPASFLPANFLSSES